MLFLIYSFLFAILGILLYKFIWVPKEGKEKSNRESNETIYEEQQTEKNIPNLKKGRPESKLATDWEVSDELSTNSEKNSKKYSSPAFEVVKPNIEFFQSYDYPELADYELKTRFNENRITALVRDPYWIYLYWEINELFELNGQPVLKVLDITGKNYPHSPANDAFTVEINLEARDWYLKMPAANRSYTVEMGIQQDSGDFNLLARSNYFTTPRDKPSDKYDPEWMTIDGIFKRSYKTPNSDGTFDTESSPLGEALQPGAGKYVSSPLGPGEYVSSPMGEYVSSPTNGKTYQNPIEVEKEER